MEDIILYKSIESKYINVCRSKIHYLHKKGMKKNVVLLHGMPSSSYLWRHVMNNMSDDYNCFAPDMIGMGKSDKPKISYTIDDHITYIHNFIKELGLTDVILVLHAWGSIVGFEYARCNPDNVAGLAFYESHIKTQTSNDELSLPVAELMAMIKAGDNVYDKVMHDNYLVKSFLSAGMLGKLSEQDLSMYLEPFNTVESRAVLLQYINELPFGNKENRVKQIIDNYNAFLQNTDIAKLLLYSIPGFTTSIANISWAKKNLTNLTVSEIGLGLHFAQETSHSLFSKYLNNWLDNIE